MLRPKPKLVAATQGAYHVLSFISKEGLVSLTVATGIELISSALQVSVLSNTLRHAGSYTIESSVLQPQLGNEWPQCDWNRYRHMWVMHTLLTYYVSIGLYVAYACLCACIIICKQACIYACKEVLWFHVCQYMIMPAARYNPLSHGVIKMNSFIAYTKESKLHIA